MALNEYLSPAAPMSAQDEAGASDNVLTLNPNDPQWKDALSNLKDGEETSFTIRVRQESPGKFFVLSGECSGCEDKGEGETTEAEPAETEEPSETPSKYPNPAVRGMMGDM